ncbi:MAG: hypothetical protein ABSE73_08230 [Planctomycetota bacterium]
MNLEKQDNRQHQRILFLDDGIRAALTGQFDPTAPVQTGQRALMRQAMRHLPALLADLQQIGLGLQPDSYPDGQRRPIDKSVWAALGDAAKTTGLDRQIILRALLRRELGLLRQPASQPTVPPLL